LLVVEAVVSTAFDELRRLRFSITMSLDGYVADPKQSVTHPLSERGDELHKWAFAVRGFRELHGMEGGTTGPDDDVAAESLQNIGATFAPLPRNSSISASGNVSR
jgi:hypothetical protein